MTGEQRRILRVMAQEGQQAGLHDVRGDERPARDYRAAFEALRAWDEAMEEADNA